MKSIVVVSALAFTASCTALVTGDLEQQYNKAVRERGLTPVYPPREEFQVGDVFYVEYEPAFQNDLSKYDRNWLGTLNTVFNLGNDYLASRINYPKTTLTGAANARTLDFDQTDLSGGAVSVASADRQRLPIVSFPSVSGRASTAGSLGGFGFLRSFGLGLGQSETVSLDLGDTRAFGAPESALRFNDDFKAEFTRQICPRIQQIVPHECPKGKTCSITVVSRTIMTRKMTYSYSSARIGRVAASILRSELDPANKTTLAVPGNLNVDLTVGPDATPEQLDTLVAALTTNIGQAKVDGAETSGLNFVGVQGSSLVFERLFNKPVAVAYEGLEAASSDVRAQLCHQG